MMFGAGAIVDSTQLVERSDANKMTLNNVAIVFAPILFRFNTNDLDQMIRLSDQENTVVKLCVEHNAVLFVRPQMCRPCRRGAGSG